MVDAQTIGVLVTAASVSIATAYYISMLRTNTKTRQAQLFTQIYQSFMSPEFNEAEFVLYNVEFQDVNDWNELLKDKEKYSAWLVYIGCLEGIGVLVRENLIDIRLPALLMSGAVYWIWERYKPGILDCRIKLNYPRFMIELEYLYNRVKDYASEHPELRITSPSLT